MLQFPPYIFVLILNMCYYLKGLQVAMVLKTHSHFTPEGKKI